ncbi:MAG TPA: pseudouridine-5'-phosphate glycosidase [Candidatus Limnocylindria bacterium]|nr:pseudouridine-5'-phosphate glycosidase [Candidatus Limnocylindria bacterium]
MDSPLAASPLLRVAPPVAAALAAGEAVVALESTLVTHGLEWPRNLQAARAAEAAVRSTRATPATIAVHDGRLLIGLTDAQLEELAQAPGSAQAPDPAHAPDPAKASRASLALALAAGGWAGTTVSATMIAAQLAGIAVFATGGIGGVHRGGERTLDVSADLDELARTPVLVVCSGPKSILDVDLTLEYLETRGVPVVGWRTSELAGFYARESGRLLGAAVEDAGQAARLARTHWSLGLATGLLLTVPVPADAALTLAEAEAAIARAVADAEAVPVRGAAATPWILARVAELTSGRSVAANLALIENNARVAGEVAVALAHR